MNYTQLANTNLRVSSIALGCWPFGGGYDWGDFDEKTAQKAVFSAFEQGVNFVDTAPIYGDGASERFLANILKGRRQDVIVATKCGLVKNGSWTDHNLTSNSIQEQLESSLHNLQTDYIDLYQIHYLDPKVPLPEVVDCLLKYKQQGKIRHIGICNVTCEQLKQDNIFREFVTVQNEFSILHPQKGIGMQNFCNEQKIGFLAYGALCGGILSGKYKKEPNFRRADARNYFYKCYKGDAFAKALELVERIKTVSTKLNVSVASVSLAWILKHNFISSVLCGMKTPEQVMQNLQAVDIVLTKEDVEFLKGNI